MHSPALESVEEWSQIDHALRTIAKQRGQLDAHEAKWLREAIRVKIWREVGYPSMIEYLERRLGYAPRTAYDRVRVATALATLPKLEAKLRDGLPHSAVRELTRVCTNENEERWIRAIEGRSVHEIEAMVAGHGRGSDPDDPKHSELIGRTIPFEAIMPATMALLRDARRKAQQERGGAEGISDNDLLATVFRFYLEGGTTERTKAPFQVAVTVCENCERGWQVSGGRKFELSNSDLSRACCDSERIGAIDTAEPARASQDVPPSVRRLVYRRDQGRCRVPGCRSTRCLEVHHIVARVLGGGHGAENLISICDGCHAALHRGMISISGTSSDLVVTREHEVTYEQNAAANDESAHVGTTRERMRTDAQTALIGLGYQQREAAEAVELAMRKLDYESLEELIRAALSECRRN